MTVALQVFLHQNLKCDKKVLIVEKRRSKDKPALEVQRLLSTLDLITASTTLKLTISHFHIPKIYFQDTRKIK